VDGLRADVARLTFCVLRAFLDRDRDGLLIFFARMILLGAACFLNLFAELIMAAFLPVLRLAGRPAVACAAAAAFLPQSKAKGGSAGSALREDHLIIYCYLLPRC
jgi:hypothetical protein